MTILDFLADVGRATAAPLWVPVLVWTLLALPVVAAVRRWTGPALLRYRLLQSVLAALPAGIAGAVLAPYAHSLLSPASSSGGGVSLIPLGDWAVVPAPPTAAGASPEVWAVVTGGLTITAIVAAGFGTGHLVVDAFRRSRLPDGLFLDRDDALQAEVDRLRQDLGVERRVTACWTPCDVVPMALGPHRPTLVLPASLRDDDRARRLTLLHELVHVRRFDDVAATLERLIGALATAHPLAAYLVRRLSALREEACDAAVLDTSPTQRAPYARLLLSFADRPAYSTRTLLLAESPSSLKDRLQAMRSPSSSPSRPLVRILTGGLAVLLIAGIVACSDSVSPDTTADPATQASNASSSSAVAASDLDTPPRPKGGMQAVQNAVEYPEIVSKAGIEGRVDVRFVVNKDGSVSNPHAVTPADGPVAHEALQRAAVEAVRSLTFTPGVKDGQPHPAQMTMPIPFRLDDENASSARSTSSTEGGGSLFEKAGIQIIEVSINTNGDVLLDGEPVRVENLASTARQRITRDAARAILHPDTKAPPEAVEAVRAQLESLSLQKIYVRQSRD